VTSARTVEIPSGADTGGSYIVGEALTIYQAAMVYSGRHPGGRFVDGTEEYGRAPLREYESYLGKGTHEGPRNLAWNIYCELRRMVASGEIKPIKPAYAASGEIDPLDTLIATADVAKLAKTRGESPKYLGNWMREPPRASRRSRRAVEQAIARLRENYSDREVPARGEKSDRQIHDALKRPNETKPPFSLDSTRRALRAIAPNRSR
jgi:hypothetical protein